LKIVHYVNQFFAGIGGEEKATVGPEVRDAPTGPGRKLSSLLGDEHQIIATVFCGDDYAASNEAAPGEILELIRSTGAEMVVSGPAFTSGRYGIACGRVAAAAQKAGLVALAAMHAENPGVAEAVPAPVVATGLTAREMAATLERVALAVKKLASGEALTAEDGLVGSIPRRNRLADKNAATRAVDLALARLAGDREATEIPMPDFGAVAPAGPISDPSQALIALLTEGGLVPAGNPGRLESARATKWLRYPLEELPGLEEGSHISVHGGFSTVVANANPNRILPLDVARELKDEGAIGTIYAEYFVTTGNGTSVADGARYGVEWAAELRKQGVQAAILTST
jgi:glycine reductase complex component B subunit gamma